MDQAMHDHQQDQAREGASDGPQIYMNGERAAAIPTWLLDDDDAEGKELAAYTADESESAVIPKQEQDVLEDTAARLFRRASGYAARLAALERRRAAEMAMVERAYVQQIANAKYNHKAAIDGLRQIARVLDYPGKIQSKRFAFGTLGYERKAGGVLEVIDKERCATWLADQDPSLDAASAVRITVKMDLGTAREIDHLIEEENALTGKTVPTLESTGDLSVMVKQVRAWYAAARQLMEGVIPEGCDISEATVDYYAKPITAAEYQAAIIDRAEPSA